MCKCAKEIFFLLALLLLLAFGFHAGWPEDSPKWLKHILDKDAQIIAALIALVAAWFALQSAREQAKKNADSQLKQMKLHNYMNVYNLQQKECATASLVHAEMTAILRLIKECKYIEFFEDELKKLGKDDYSYIYISQDYFSVYNKIAGDLGIIEQPLLSQIVYWYNEAKSVVDSNQNFHVNDMTADILEGNIQDVLASLRYLQFDSADFLKELGQYAEKKRSIAMDTQRKIDMLLEEDQIQAN